MFALATTTTRDRCLVSGGVAHRSARGSRPTRHLAPCATGRVHRPAMRTSRSLGSHEFGANGSCEFTVAGSSPRGNTDVGCCREGARWRGDQLWLPNSMLRGAVLPGTASLLPVPLFVFRAAEGPCRSHSQQPTHTHIRVPFPWEVRVAIRATQVARLIVPGPAAQDTRRTAAVRRLDPRPIFHGVASLAARDDREQRFRDSEAPGQPHTHKRAP